MKKYKAKIESIKSLFEDFQKAKEKAYELPSDQYDEILSLLEESNKIRAKANKQLNKLASDLGFVIMREIKYDHQFMDVVYSIERRIDAALEALNDISWFNHDIKLAQDGDQDI